MTKISLGNPVGVYLKIWKGIQESIIEWIPDYKKKTLKKYRKKFREVSMPESRLALWEMVIKES